MTGRSGAAVLGRPIAHSLSPVLHTAAYRELGLDWDYRAVECGAEELPGVVDGLDADGLAGLSLTMPLKMAVLALLDTVDPLAATLGAVNTVLLGDGRAGHNTDVAGALDALAELGLDVAAGPVAVLGAGGSARAVLTALARLGVASVTLYARDMAKAAQLVAVGERVELAVAAEPWEGARQGIRAVDLVVNTTPAGVADGLAGRDWPRGTSVFDVLYDPWPTRLAQAAAATGGRAVGGLPMLVGQAAEAVRLMTGCEPPVAAMRAAGEQALRKRD